MTTLLTGFELSPAGTAIGTSTGNGGDAFTTGINGTGTAFVSDSSIPGAIAEGSFCGKITIPATPATCWRAWAVGGPQSFRAYLYLPAYPGTNWDFVQAVHSTGGTATIGRLRISATGQLVHVLGSTAGTPTTGVIPLNTLVRVEGTFDTVGGTFTVEAYSGHSTTPIANTSISLSGLTYANTIEQLRIGFPTAGLANAVVYTDGWGVSDAGRLGPLGATAPVEVSASLSGSGTLTAAAGPKSSTSVSLSGSGTLTATKTITPGSSPSTDTLSDDFATKNTSKWTWGANAAVSGGRLALTATPAADGEIRTVGTYNLSDTMIRVELVAPATGTGAETYFAVAKDDLNTYSWAVETVSGTLMLSAYSQVNGVFTQVKTMAYSPSAHRRLAIDYDATFGNVHWLVSADASGNLFGSQGGISTSSGWGNPTSALVILGCNAPSTGTAGAVQFDNLNFDPPASVPASFTGSGTLSASTGVSGVRTAALSGTGTLSASVPAGVSNLTFATDAQIMSLSTTSAAALRAKGIADNVKNGTFVGGSTAADINIKSVDTKVGPIALTTAMWWRRTGDNSYLAPLKAFILATPKPPAAKSGTLNQALNEFRGYFGVFAAVKILRDAGAWTSADDASTLPNHNNITWAQFLNGGYTGTGGTLPYAYRQVDTGGGRWTRLRAPAGSPANEGTMDDSASNWGGVASATHLAWAVLVNDQDEIDHAALRMRKWLGDQTTGLPDFKSSGSYIASWNNWTTSTTGGSNQPLKAGVGKTDPANPGLDGVVLNDIDRGNTGYAAGSAYYGATGSGLTYPLENADFIWALAAVLINGGYPVRSWGEGGNAFDRMNSRFARHRQAGEQSELDYAQAAANVYKGARYVMSQLSQTNYELNLAVATPSGTGGLSRSMPQGDWIAPADGSSTWGAYSATASQNTAVALSGLGTLSTTVTPRLTLTAALSGSGTAAGSTGLVLTHAASLSGFGELSATANGRAAVDLFGDGQLTADTLVLVTRDGQLTGFGTLTAEPVVLTSLSVELSGSSELLAQASDPTLFVRVFHPPTQDVWFRLAGRGLIGGYAQGLTVYRVGGEWRTRLSPGADELAAADRQYTGGHVHQLSDDDYAELVAAGFADRITFQEIKV